MTFFIHCSDDTTDSTSPDLRHTARLTTHTCAGPLLVNWDTHQFIEIATAGADKSVTVFRSEDDGAVMHWDDSEQLKIELNTPSTIIVSLHETDGVHIAYHVPRRLMTLEGLEYSERQAEELYKAGKISKSDYEIERDGYQSFRRFKEDFISWASENAIIDEYR